MQKNNRRANLRNFRPRNMHDFETDAVDQDTIHQVIVRDTSLSQRGMLMP